MEGSTLQPKKEIHRLNVIIIHDSDFNYYAIHYKDEKLFRHLLIEEYRSISTMFKDYLIDNPIKYFNALPTSDITKREVDNYTFRKVMQTISRESDDLSVIASEDAINAGLVSYEDLTITTLLKDKNNEYYRIDPNDVWVFLELNSDKNLSNIFKEKFEPYKINNVDDIEKIYETNVEINKKLRSRERVIEVYRKQMMKVMTEEEFKIFCIKNNL